MLAHGLVTPTVLGQPINVWVGRLPYVAITLFAVSLLLAGRARNTGTSRLAARRPVLLIAAWGLALTALSGGLVARPTALLGAQPLASEDTFLWTVAVLDAGMLQIGDESCRESVVKAGWIAVGA